MNYLGWGLFFEWLASQLPEDACDLHEPNRRLHDLTPYDHLARLIRLCILHTLRRIKKLQGKVLPEIYQRILRVIDAWEDGESFEENLRVIRADGGSHAIGEILFLFLILFNCSSTLNSW